MTFAIGQPNDKPCRVRAFTLVELILVMTILATAFAIAAPSMSGFFRGRTQSSEARQILSLMRYGQSRAVSESIPMLLWFDVRTGTYGLEQAPGYSDNDAKAVEFTVDKDLRLDLEAVGKTIGTALRGRNLPAIRFQPDGSIGLNSPLSIAVREGENPPIWIVQSPNGMTYEIENQNKNIQNAFR